MHMTTDLAHRTTITAMVATYTLAESEIRQAYDLLEAAKNRLAVSFIPGSGARFDVNNESRPGVGKEAADRCVKGLKKDAWRCIVDRLEIRRILSIGRRAELDRQLSGEQRYSTDPLPPLPDVTEANIINMFQDGMAKAVDYANEAVLEVFDWLRPHRGRTGELKTNEKWKLGKKVIIGWAVERGYGKCAFHIRSGAEPNFIALDNVMSMLDGKGPVKGHQGELVAAIRDSVGGIGETAYFKFKSCKNGNIHIDFKRLDLVDKINKAGGSDRNNIGGMI